MEKFVFKQVFIILATLCFTFYNLISVYRVFRSWGDMRERRMRISSNNSYLLRWPLRENWDQFRPSRNFAEINSIYGEPNNTLSSIHWSDLVFMMNIHSSLETDRLIKAHFDTWLKHVGKGADIVFITDRDDARLFNETLPDEALIQATCHLYKSPAEKEGNHLRFKIIDGFRHVIESKFNSTKKYYLKIDSDTYVRPLPLLEYLDSLHKKTYPKPVHFGNAICRPAPFCYTDGAFYGFNDVGFTAVNSYFTKNVVIPGDSWNKFMKHEDFMVSVAFKEATKFQMIHYPYFFSFKGNDTDMKVRTFLGKGRGISLHPLKNEEYFYL